MASRMPTRAPTKSQSSMLRWPRTTSSRATPAAPAQTPYERCKVAPDATDSTRPPPRTGNTEEFMTAGDSSRTLISLLKISDSAD